MFSKAFLAALAASGSLAHPIITARQAPSCASGVYMFVARGSTEPQGEGVESSVVSSVQKSIPGSNGEGINYPATLTDYLNSESEGVTSMTQAIQSYTQACPDGKYALMGFSQGAQVVGDVLGGAAFGGSGPIDKSFTKNLVAAILFGDPSHTAGKPYNQGSSTNNGVSPRSNSATLDSYSDLLQSYCDTGDQFCDNGGNSAVHAQEVSKHGSEAAQFIVSKFNGGAGSSSGSGSGSSGASPTPTTTPASGPAPTPSTSSAPGFPGFPSGGSGTGGGFPTRPTGGFPGLPTGGFPSGGGFPSLPSGFPGWFGNKPHA